MICREWTLLGLGYDTVKLCTMYCRSWGCEVCGPKRRKQLQALAASGLPERFVTLTVNPAFGANPEDRLKLLAHAWRLAVKRYRREHGKDSLEYIAFVEATKAGEPHLHILVRSGWIDHDWLSSVMAELIEAPVVDVRKLKGLRQAIFYVTKYVTKAPARFGASKRYWKSSNYDQTREEYERERDTRILEWRILRFTLTEMHRFIMDFPVQEPSRDTLEYRYHWGVPPDLAARLDRLL